MSGVSSSPFYVNPSVARLTNDTYPLRQNVVDVLRALDRAVIEAHGPLINAGMERIVTTTERVRRRWVKGPPRHARWRARALIL